jgi:hypothetical protein
MGLHESAGGYTTMVVVVVELVVVATVVLTDIVVVAANAGDVLAASTLGLAASPSRSTNMANQSATMPLSRRRGISHSALLRFGSGAGVQSSKSNSPVSSVGGGGGGAGIGALGDSVVEVASAPPLVAVPAAVAFSILTSIQGFPQFGQSVSSPGRGVPQWIQIGRFDEVFVIPAGYG